MDKTKLLMTLDIVLIIVAVAAICFAYKDLTTIKSTVDKNTADCNSHWEKQFETNCRMEKSDMDGEFGVPLLNFSNANTN